MVSIRILPSAASLGLILCLTGCFPVAMGLAGFGGGYMLKDQVAPSRSTPPPRDYSDSDMPRMRSSYMPPSYGSPTTAPLYPANPYASARPGAAPSPDTAGLYAIPAAPAPAPMMPAYPVQMQQAMPPQGMALQAMPPQGIPPQGAMVPTAYVPAAYPPAGAYQPAPPGMAPMPYGNMKP